MTPVVQRERRWARRAGIGSLAIAVLMTLTGLIAYGRIDRFELRPPPDRPGTTFLLVGEDSRAGVAVADTRFGTVKDMPGSRADVVVLLHIPEGGPVVAAALPRDLLVFDDQLVPRRLTVTHLTGPQTTVDALCRSVGIAVDHVVRIDFEGFEQLVNAAGGVDVRVDEPVRDRFSGLHLDEAGPQTLDGAQALALVRSRHPENRSGDGWKAAPAGAALRTGSTRAVLSGTARRLGPTHPVRSLRMAWAATGAVSADAAASPADFIRLGRALESAELIDVPASTTESAIPTAELAPGAAAALARLGAADQAPCERQLLTARRNHDA